MRLLWANGTGRPSLQERSHKHPSIGRRPRAARGKVGGRRSSTASSATSSPSFRSRHPSEHLNRRCVGRVPCRARSSDRAAAFSEASFARDHRLAAQMPCWSGKANRSLRSSVRTMEQAGRPPLSARSTTGRYYSTKLNASLPSSLRTIDENLHLRGAKLRSNPSFLYRVAWIASLRSQ